MTLMEPDRRACAADDGRTSMIDDIRVRIGALGLDLSGLNVVTEAATGAYACTAVIAALAGAARVVCTARDTVRYGSFDDAATETLALARMAGVADRIDIRRRLEPRVFESSDIVTNSGHLRPLSAAIIDRLPHEAVIALMFEDWEFRPADLDLAACRARGIRVAAVNERHPDVAVFPILGPLCVRLLADAGLPVAGARLGLLCDNPFAPYLQAGLVGAGASVALAAVALDLPDASYDAVVVALDPSRNPPLDDAIIAHLTAAAPGAVIAQFWGDIDPAARVRPGCRFWPPRPPGRGHMGILLNALGHDPIVRLQAGGLRAAEILRRGLRVEEGGVAVPL